jgi:hypothetical protein
MARLLFFKKCFGAILPAVILLVAFSLTGLGQEVVWPPAPLPAGSNPAANPAPRFDVNEE